jgi:Tfp pilus assembly protein PilX
MKAVMVIKNRETKQLVHAEGGFASLVVGLILIVVLGLMTIGFARLSRHEQQQALDGQLASEANYAAESGINDVINGIQNNLITTSTTGVNTGSCLSLPLAGTATNYLNTTYDVSYSCVIVYLKTAALEYSNVNYGSSRSIVTSTTGPLTSLTVNWGSADTHSSFPPIGTKFPTFPTWNTDNYPPVLQLSITPLNSTMTRTNLIDNAFTVFLYPSSSGSSTVNYNLSNVTAGNKNGTIIPGSCTTATAPYDCKVTITNVTGTGQYLIRVLDLYDASDIRMTGTDSGGNPVVFSGGQAEIDVTGKAKDVLKRLNVSVPINGSSYPDYALEAQNICKQIETGPVTLQNPNPTTFIDPTTGGATTANPCGLTNIN